MWDALKGLYKLWAKHLGFDIAVNKWIIGLSAPFNLSAYILVLVGWKSNGVSRVFKITVNSIPSFYAFGAGEFGY